MNHDGWGFSLQNGGVFSRSTGETNRPKGSVKWLKCTLLPWRVLYGFIFCLVKFRFNSTLNPAPNNGALRLSKQKKVFQTAQLLKVSQKCLQKEMGNLRNLLPFPKKSTIKQPLKHFLSNVWLKWYVPMVKSIGTSSNRGLRMHVFDKPHFIMEHLGMPQKKTEVGEVGLVGWLVGKVTRSVG